MLEEIKIFYTSVYLLLFPLCHSQNIIPNGSFETYTACPNSVNTNSPDELKKTVNWYSILQTPDYYNVCATTTVVGVPNNFLGYQMPASGNSYMGFTAYVSNTSNAREIIASKLTTTLSIGQKYFTKLLISLSEGYNTNCGIDKVGLRFSTVPHTLVSAPPINNFAHLYFTTIMADTLNWKSVFGSFIADSNYQYVEIGNFFTDVNTNVQVLKPKTTDWAYYYLDDVCLSTDSLEALNYSATGISEINKKERYNLFYPNPCQEKVYCKINLVNYSLKINDIYGDEITDYTLNHDNTIEFRNIPNGIYIVTISQGEKIKKEIIIINN